MSYQHVSAASKHDVYAFLFGLTALLVSRNLQHIDSIQ